MAMTVQNKQQRTGALLLVAGLLLFVTGILQVNANTVDYGDTGRRAVAELLGRAHRAGLVPAPSALTFVAAA